MFNPDTEVVFCEKPDDIIGAMNRMINSLPTDLKEIKVKLNSVKLDYWTQYGLAGLHDRVSGRTVTQILAEYSPIGNDNVVASGEVDGVKFSVYKASDESKQDYDSEQG